MKLADPVTVKQLLGWAATAVVSVFVAAMSCGTSVVSRAEAAAAAQVAPIERRLSDHEKSIARSLEIIQADVKKLLERR